MNKQRHGRRLLFHMGQLAVIALGSYVLANLWNAANATKDHAIALPIDAHVPLLPWTTAIYLGFFLLYLVPARMAYGNQARMDELDRIVPMMVGWTVLHSVFFVLVPAEIPRPVTPSDAWPAVSTKGTADARTDAAKPRGTAAHGGGRRVSPSFRERRSERGSTVKVFVLG